MSQSSDRHADGEPLSSPVSDDTDGALVDRVMTIAHLPQTAHVAVIGHRTLPLVVALLRRGSEGVRSLRPGSPAPDCEPVDLAWIVDLHDERELDEALRAARWRTGKRGRVILEGALAAVCNRAVAAGLDIISFDHVARRLVLAPARLAAAA